MAFSKYTKIKSATMTISNSGLNWSTSLLQLLYSSIKYDNKVDLQLLLPLKNDLIGLLQTPPRNDSSRKQLEDDTKTHIFSNGEEVKLNKEFIAITAVVSADFHLDELASADLTYQAQSIAFSQGLSLQESARLLYFERYLYILNISGFIISSRSLNLLSITPDTYSNNILSSFTKVYDLIALTNDSIDKQKVTDNINNISFLDQVAFTKSQLFNIHELLSKILYSLIDNYTLPISFIEKLSTHINSSISNDDSLILHYFPSLCKLITNEDRFEELYTTITQKINQDYEKVSKNDEIDISNSSFKSYELVVYLIFFTKFITWCKIHPSRTSKYDFKSNVLIYIEKLINYGVMETLLNFTAESTNIQTKDVLEWRELYDFRSLLQRECPRLHPAKFEYPSAQELITSANSRLGFENVYRLGEVSDLTISSDFYENLLIPFFHDFFLDFISNLAIVLTSLRDSEEDFLLSSINKKQLEFDKDDKKFDDHDSPDSLNLDEIATKSELERFYLAFTYTFNNRPELCASFWFDDYINDTTGLINWGLSNNSSPLITSTFCLVLGSLASAGNDAAVKVWDLLIENNTTLKKNDFSIISIDSILLALKYYINSLNENYDHDLNEQLKSKQKRQELLFSKHSGKQNVAPTSVQIVIQLSEDSILFISGFVQLISAVVRHLSSSDLRAKYIKGVAFDRFNGLITQFLKFDNTIKGYNIQKKSDQPKVNISTENSAVVLNLFFGLLGDFVVEDDDLDLRYNIWRILDKWVYHSIPDETENGNSDKTIQSAPKERVSKRLHIGLLQGFETNLEELSEVTNFSHLLEKLLTPLRNKSEAFAKYNLLYPADLGLGYRSNNALGIWPYMEYLITNVFANSNRITDTVLKQILQGIIINILHNSLNEIDWRFLANIASNALKDFKSIDCIFDSLIPGIELNFSLFTKLHHSIASISYMFNDKVYNTLFSIIDTGADRLFSDKLVDLHTKSLQIFDTLLELQDTFISKLSPSLRNDKQPATKVQAGFNTSMSLALKTPVTIFDNIYILKDIGTFGVLNFYELLLFNLPTVVQFALYVGSPETDISNASISILSKINKSSAFVSKSEFKSNDVLLKKNRLLTTFMSIDESTNVQHAFIQQLESQSEDMDIKYKILQFILDDLKLSSGTVPTTSHFLLGFIIRGGQIGLGDQLKNNLLKSLLELLDVSLSLLCQIDYRSRDSQSIDYAPAKLSALILEIIVTLSRQSITGNTVLIFLREHNELFEKLVKLQPKIDLETIWYCQKFDGDLNEDVRNTFIEDQRSFDTLVLFVKFKNMVLQYLSLEFNSIVSKFKKVYYSSLLLDNKVFLDGSPRILGFLDTLNYTFRNFETRKVETYEQRYNIPIIMDEVCATEGVIDVTVLNKIYKIYSQGQNLITEDSKQKFAETIMIEANHFKDFILKCTMTTSLRRAQLDGLNSWCELIQTTVNNNISEEFILEILQVILPKINDYLESDIQFSEELVSLCVILIDKYENFLTKNNVKSSDEKPLVNDKRGNQLILTDKSDFHIGMRRLTPVLKTCVNGIINSNSSPNLRSDLYVLANKYLSNVFGNEELLSESKAIIRTVDKKLIEVVGNDGIYSEGSSRITLILLLETLVHLDENVLTALISNNSLLLLVMSIKRVDESLETEVTLDRLFYELTSFKSTLYFLIRVAQTKVGALKLIQNELFSILKGIKILKVDPDLGIELKVENKEVNLSLDAKEGNISYQEFLVPIFQLVCTIVISMGPSYNVKLAKDLYEESNRLIVGVMKRDLILENENKTDEGIEELAKLITLLDSLINYKHE